MPGAFDGKAVVITGGAGALGGAVVEAFLAAGASVHVPARKSGELADRPGLRVTPDIDLTDEASVTAYYGALPSLWASVHLAGAFAMGPFVSTSLADFRKQLDLNAVTAFLCCREAVKRMQGGGRIVNVSSRGALSPSGGTVAYGASKGALNVLTQALADEVRAQGILVNAIAPSIIDTPANRAAMPNANHASWPRGEQLARAILWLASTENTLTTGTIIPVYGNG